jgi:phosphoesterase RecJ-like protein
VMVSTDASDEERTGAVGAYGRAHAKHVINLDHHMTNLFFGDAFLVKVDAVSATEVVLRWLKHMDHPLTKDIAVALLTGLVTDTMGFRTSNVTAETLGMAQELMQSGASITEVTARTLDSKPYRAFKLWSGALQSLSLDDQVVSVNITQEDMKAAGVTDVSDAGLVGMLNQVNEAMIAVIFMEAEGKRVKLSFRAKNGYDVGSVAVNIGGGGHRQASGATVEGTLDEVRERVMPLLKQAVADGELIIA